MKASKFKPTSASTDHCDNYGSIGWGTVRLFGTNNLKKEAV
jgi:hypothetical protein